MAKVIVYHTGYGCDTGCCGHAVEIEGKRKFSFSHPWSEDPRAWAEELIRKKLGPEHVADLDWDNSFVTED